MSVLLALLTAALVLDALRVRARLARLVPLRVPPTQSTPPTQGHEVPVGWLAAGADPPAPELLWRAHAHCEAQGLDALDLVPSDLGALRALSLGALVDPRTYRKDRLARGYSAGHLLVLARPLCERAEIRSGHADLVEFANTAARVKAYACTTSDFAVTDGLPRVPEAPELQLQVLRAIFDDFTPFVLGAQLLVYTLLVLGVSLPQTRMWGAAACIAFQLQPLIATRGTALRPWDLLRVCLLRLPLELLLWVRTAASAMRSAPDPEIAERRAGYAAFLAADPATFFEPRRDDCPLCGSRELRVQVRTADLLQRKPGIFTLERCTTCAHIFQNPRLSLAGLDFYYRDFYDGLGGRRLASVFGWQNRVYLDRARMVQRALAPARWLDVGAGQGHFCCVASDVLPKTRFDGLDLSGSIDEAARRGWVATAYRGLFPDSARRLCGAYDVVSMHHYLEHTIDPAQEIEAAHIALSAHGHLLIELPDPESRMAPLLGRYWMPWFQPQHQHLLSVGNLERLLCERGFTPVQWERGEAHLCVDLRFAVYLLLSRLAPPRDNPWTRPPTRAQRLLRSLIWGLGAPLIVLAALTDGLIGPLMRKPGASNAYRVLARKNP